MTRTQTCHGCQLVSQPLKPEPMTRTEFPSAPWQHLAAELLGPLPSGDYIFVVVDYYSRFFEIEFTKSITTEKIVSLMSKMFVTHGLPCSLRLTMDRSLSVTTSKVILRKTVLNIDEPHLYGHRPMEKLKGRTVLF